MVVAQLVVLTRSPFVLSEISQGNWSGGRGERYEMYLFTEELLYSEGIAEINDGSESMRG